MGKADPLRNRVEPFAALLWALGIVHCTQYSTCQYLTLPAGPASLHSRTQSMTLLYMVIVGSILSEDVLAPPLPI